ncbi:MAG: beta strand repeat-containing protein, partial [Betaproteobacteria bacterium]
MQKFAASVGGAGGLALRETNDLEIGNVVSQYNAAMSVVVQTVQPTGSTTTDTRPVVSDVATTAGNGSVVIRAGGTLTLNDGSIGSGIAVSANGSGNILLQALGASTNVLVNADILSGSGNVSVLAKGAVSYGADADFLTTITAASSGSIDVWAVSVAIPQHATSLLRSTGASAPARLVAGSSVTVGDIEVAGDVGITAGSGAIVDADALATGANDSDQDIIAGRLRLSAGSAIADAVNHLDVTVATLTARAAAGGIWVLEANDLVIGDVGLSVNRVKADATTFTIDSTDATQSDVRTTGANGSIVLRTASGSITLGDGTAAQDGMAVSAHGTGNVLIQAGLASPPVVTPSVALPAAFTVLSTNGEIRLANAVGNGVEQLTVVLSIAGGPTGATPTLSSSTGNSAGNTPFNGVVVSGSGTTSLTLSGSAADLSAFLDSADRIRFSGTASSTSYELTFTAQSMNGSGVQSATSAKAAVSAVQLGVPAGTTTVAPLSTAPTLQVPAAFTALSSNGEIRFATDALSGTTGNVTLVLAVSHSSITNAMLSTSGGNGTSNGVAVSGSGTGVLSLSGTATDINTFLKAADRVRFNGAASPTAYSLKFSAQAVNATVVQSAATADAALTSVQLGGSGTASTSTAPALAVPATINALPSSGEIRFATNSITGAGTLTVVLAVSGGPSGATPKLVSADGNETVAGVEISGSNSNRLTLRGADTAISAYLNAANRIAFTGTSSATPYVLSVTAQSMTGSAVTAASTAQIALVTTGAAGTATPIVAPTLNLPASFSTPAINGEVRIANAVGTGTDVVTVVLAVRGGPAGAAPTLSSALGNGLSNEVTVSGNATSALTLTGTASAVSTYLSAANRILFNGPASSTTYTVTATAQRISGGVVQSATSSQALLTSIVSGTAAASGSAQSFAPLTLNAPTSLTALSVNGQIRFAGAVGDSSEPLTVVLALSGGPNNPTPAPSLVAVDAGGVSVAGSGPGTLSLSGTATALTSFLVSSTGGVRFNGQASQTAYTLTTTVQSATAGVIRSARSATASLTSIQTGSSG